MNDFWFKSESFFEADKEHSLIFLFRKICNVITENKCKSILDYGVGEGLLFKEFDDETLRELSLGIFDLNFSLMNQVYHKLKNRTREIKIFDSSEHKSMFDAVVCCLVDVCVEKEEEFKDLIRKCYEATKQNGIFLFATTHPCFRDNSFWGFETSFSVGNQFDYFVEPQNFELYYGKEKINIVDTHRTLSNIINTILSEGFSLHKFEEIKDYEDDKFSKQYNNKSPFVLLTFKK